MWRVDDDVGGVASGHLRLVPGAAALLVGEATDDLSYAAGRRLIHDGTNHC